MSTDKLYKTRIERYDVSDMVALKLYDSSEVFAAARDDWGETRACLELTFGDEGWALSSPPSSLVRTLEKDIIGWFKPHFGQEFCFDPISQRFLFSSKKDDKIRSSFHYVQITPYVGAYAPELIML